MGEARNIYNAACAQIAAALAQDGFEYPPSKHALVGGDGDLTREITFQSSFRNFTLPEKGAGFVQKAVSLLPLVGETAAFGGVTLIAHTGGQTDACAGRVHRARSGDGALPAALSSRNSQTFAMFQSRAAVCGEI